MVYKLLHELAIERGQNGRWVPIYILILGEMVDPSGIEPLTSCMPCRRSPS